MRLGSNTTIFASLLLLGSCASPLVLRSSRTIDGTQPQPPVVLTLPGGSPALAVVRPTPFAEPPRGCWIATADDSRTVWFTDGDDLPVTWTGARQLTAALAVGRRTQRELLGGTPAVSAYPILLPEIDPQRSHEITITFDAGDGIPIPTWPRRTTSRPTNSRSRTGSRSTRPPSSRRCSCRPSTRTVGRSIRACVCSPTGWRSM